MQTGFLGLGAMGAPMARNLHRAGLLHGVWNRTASRARQLATELNCVAATTPAALASQCEALVSCVSADDDLLAVVESTLPGLRSGQLFIDCSTVSADTARRAGQMLATRQVAFLDAPVSGGVEGAVGGTLAIMVGGNAADFARAAPLLQAVGRTITHFGAQGAGQAAKATNQIMAAGINRAVAEAMAFASAQGLDLQQVIATLSHGASDNWYLRNRAPFMAAGSYPPGFRIRLHAKDLRICHAMAAARGAELPVIEETLREYQQLIDMGFGDEDVSALHRLKQALFAGGTGA